MIEIWKAAAVPHASLCWHYHSLAWFFLQPIKKTQPFICQVEFSYGCPHKMPARIYSCSHGQCACQVASTKKYQKVKFSFLIKQRTISIEACSINFKIYLTDVLFRSAVPECHLEFSFLYIVSRVLHKFLFGSWQNIELRIYYLMCFKEWNHHLFLAGALAWQYIPQAVLNQLCLKLPKLLGDTQSIKPLAFKSISNSPVIKEVLLTQ